MRLKKYAGALAIGLAAISVILASSPASAATVVDTTTLPYDVSYPQCDNLPTSNGVPGIVGINDGKPMGVNPCLATQLVWAGGTAASFYMNTANPGPTQSKYWPAGTTSPKVCDAANPDTIECAYNYGYASAEFAFNSLSAAFTSSSLTLTASTSSIWLDVETSNSWTTDFDKNVAVIQGAVDNLKLTHSVGTIGIYSTTKQWGEITGGNKTFSALPFWGAGAASALTAIDICGAKIGPTGGPIQLVQFILNGFDQNLVCANAPKISATIAARVPTSIKHGKTVTVKAKLVSENKLPVVNVKVTLRLGKKKFTAITGANGIAKIKVTAPLTPGFSLVTISANGGTSYGITSLVSSTQIK